eukprot:TRINITY_DN3049_c0_g1_i1.p2 TRINITY_DN3049_c0_g1~~TRINITY_DN3049_c0_g1_i1.p2  ORF type:complete len:128 (-),score=17.93 TRINITY_DN3049_c0_g1_i1:124-507(-)
MSGRSPRCRVNFGTQIFQAFLVCGLIDAAHIRGTVRTEPSPAQMPMVKELAVTLAGRRPRSGKNRLPSQGFEGVPVRHSNGTTYADDWGNEYPIESDETDHIRYSESWNLGEEKTSPKDGAVESKDD